MAFDSLSERLQKAMKKITGRGKLHESDIDDMLREVRLSLLEADVNFKVIRKFLAAVKEKALGAKILDGLNPGQQVVDIVRNELKEVLGSEEVELNLNKNGLTVIMLVGLQGAGKTTACGKIALYLRKKYKKTPLLVAADVYRPAAVDQLVTLAKQIGVAYYEDGIKTNPRKIVKEGINKAIKESCDTVIIDTAGRLQVNEELMDELKDIKEIARPHEILLTVDSMSGQDACNVATAFNEKIAFLYGWTLFLVIQTGTIAAVCVAFAKFFGILVPCISSENLLFKIGILNEVYGNWTGGVTHPYSIHQFWQRFVNIVFSMGGYDEFLAGAFWFFRGLFVASIAFVILYCLLNSTKLLRDRVTALPLAICLLAFGFALFKAGEGIRIATLFQGGYRDTMGVLFFGVGVLYRQYEDRIGHSLWLAAIGAAIVLGGAALRCTGMILNPTIRDVYTLPITGIAGWIMTYNISFHLAKLKNIATRFLVYCGEHTLYVFIWHVSAYKLVSLLKIWWYDLDPRQIGCHMVIHDYAATDGFWILYTIVGVGLPLYGYYLYSTKVRPFLQSKMRRH